MRDSECIAFLQWALPQLQMRWPGYRKVRGQVCKRVARRMRDLGLESIEAYRARLADDPNEWVALDGLARITISRFFRDRDVFEYLCDEGLSALRDLAAPQCIRIWSAGCAGGEEAYTLAIAAYQQHAPVNILGTDADEHQLLRARRGAYTEGCLKHLPRAWRELAFEPVGGELVLNSEFRTDVKFSLQDIRSEMPTTSFHLVLCRYMVFTYFNLELQQRIAQRLLERTVSNGLLVLGKHESWPDDVGGVVEVKAGLRIYRKE